MVKAVLVWAVINMNFCKDFFDLPKKTLHS